MNSHESRESRSGADESDGDRAADLARRQPPATPAAPAPAAPPADPTGPTGPRDAVAPPGDARGGGGDAEAAGRRPTSDSPWDDPALRAAFEEADIPFEPSEDDIAHANRWDADDPRRQDDHFAPPTEPCECHCLHCGRTFSSDGIWFQRVINDPQGFQGFWMCPTANCSGAGFTFDIFPTDPDHPANEGWHSFDDEDEEDAAAASGDDEDDASTGEGDDGEDGSHGEDDPDDLFGPRGRSAGAEEEYDPAEPRYKELDAFYGEDDDDLEGEEWKYGLQPGERPADAGGGDRGRREWEEEQRRYDEPDQRPRVLDWSDREDRDDRRPGSGGPGGGGPHADGDGQFKDDDIPF